MSETVAVPVTAQNGAASSDEKTNWSRLGIVFWIAVSWVCLITFSAAFADFLPFQDPLKTNLRATFSPMFTDGHI